MDWVITIITLLITGGLGATIGTIYTAKKSTQVGMSGNEIEAAKATTADWAAYTAYTSKQTETLIGRLDERIQILEANQSMMLTRAFEDSLFIDELQDHINKGLGPPAPTRKPYKE